MRSLLLFADTRDDPLRSPEVIWGVAGLTIALLVGAAVIYAVDQWRKRATAEPTAAAATAQSATILRGSWRSARPVIEITSAPTTKPACTMLVSSACRVSSERSATRSAASARSG